MRKALTCNVEGRIMVEDTFGSAENLMEFKNVGDGVDAGTENICFEEQGFIRIVFI